jgi:hypothetical protein
VGPAGQREKREEAPRSEGATQRRKCIFESAPMGRGPDGPADWSGGLWGSDGLARWTRPVEPDARRNSNGKMIFGFQLNLHFGKTLRNCTRRFRRNLDMGIFPKLF